jgi:hypothetical protein
MSTQRKSSNGFETATKQSSAACGGVVDPHFALSLGLMHEVADEAIRPVADLARHVAWTRLLPCPELRA